MDFKGQYTVSPNPYLLPFHPTRTLLSLLILELYSIPPPSFLPPHQFTRLTSMRKSQFDTSKADGQFRKPASNARLLSLINEPSKSGGKTFAFTPFDVALKQTVEWFVANYETEARTGKGKKTTA